jgi:DNA-binding PadR family transcriptional regulator
VTEVPPHRRRELPPGAAVRQGGCFRKGRRGPGPGRAPAEAGAPVDCPASRVAAMEWALPEWTVLGLVREQPRHGFAVAALTARDAEVGRVWQIPRPVIYRAIGRLQDAAQISTVAVESGAGPQRTVYAVTDAGRNAVDEWVQTPVEHVRELRSHLLMKLVLLDRRDLDRRPLLRRQRAMLKPMVEAIAVERDRREGFDVVLLDWRHAAARAALDFVDGLLEE